MLQRYGITTRDFSGSLIYGLALTAVGLIIINLIALFFTGYKFSFDPMWFVFYLFVSAPFQELVFRGVIQTSLYRFGRVFAVVTAAAAYSAIHFPDSVMVVLTMGAGLAWGYAFHKKRNLIGPAVSHAVLGAYLFVFVL